MWKEGVMSALSEHSANILTEKNCDKPQSRIVSPLGEI